MSRPTMLWEHFHASILVFIARCLYSLAGQGWSNARNRPDSVRIVAISDTHNSHNLLPPLPDGDILIHAGDLTNFGTVQEIDAALYWLQAQTHTHKIFIAGDHDHALTDLATQAYFAAKYPNLTYLQDAATSVTVRGSTLRIYGNAQTPRHGHAAFTYPRIAPVDAAAGAARVWAHVPTHTNVLVTHGPPAHHLDAHGKGCAGLLRTVWRVRPRVHVFGHIHSGRGVERVTWTPEQTAAERIASDLGRWADLVPIGKATVLRVWACLWGEPGSAVGGETIMANVAACNGPGDGMLRGAVVIDI